MFRIVKTAPILTLIILAVVFLANSGGSPGRRTGSPSDGSSCATNGGCHGPKTPENSSMLSTSIPESGYVPGEEYDITVSASKAGINRYGFEIVAENGSGDAQGSFVDNDNVNATNNRATHKFQSITGNGSNSWTITWVAPQAGSGDVSFYVAVLAANGNGTTSGDNVLLDNLTVSEGQSASVSIIEELGINVYPNPTTEKLFIEGANEGFRKITVMDLSEKVLISTRFTSVLEVSELASGNYILSIQSSDVVIRKPFIKR